MGVIRSLDALHPMIKARVDDWIAAVHTRGIDMIIVETYRSLATSAAYFAQGRKKPAEIETLRAIAGLTPLKGEAEYRKIITKAQPGESWHNYGLAVDFVPVVNNVADWAYTPNDPKDHYDEIAEEAVKAGLEWGGQWRTFKDYPHVQARLGWVIEDAKKFMATSTGFLPIKGE